MDNRSIVLIAYFETTVMFLVEKKGFAFIIFVGGILMFLVVRARACMHKITKK